MAIKFLTGAPSRVSLDWTQEELLDEFLPPFSRFIKGESKLAFPAESPSGSWPSWRTVTSVPTRDKGLTIAPDSDQSKQSHTSHSHGNTSPRSVQVYGTPIIDDGNDDLENSFATHEFFEPSQVTPITQLNTDTSLFDNSRFESFEDFGDTSYSVLSNADDDVLERQAFPTTEHLTNLSALPNAEYLRRIFPGTMTIDVIVGLIDISPPRAVTIRRQGGSYEMNIVDLYTKDETKAGLKITIWLKPETRNECRPRKNQQVALQPIVSLLRRGDIVFLKHIALRSYRGEVSGQSLSSERYPNNGTKLALLSRRPGLNWGEGARSKLENLSRSHATKLERVQAWVSQFLGTGVRANIEGSNSKKILGKRKIQDEKIPRDTPDELPADTQNELDN